MTTSGTTGMEDLIPATSPLLRPTHQHARYRNSQDSFNLTSTATLRNEDIPEDLEFLAPGTWTDHDDKEYSDDDQRSDVEDEDDQGEDDSIEDFSLEDGHIEGVPSCGVVLHAK